MSATQATPTLSQDHSKGDKFFSSSPFRSLRFIAVTMLSATVIVADAAMMIVYWDRLSPPALMWLVFIAYYGAFGPIYRAFRQHEAINELYLAGKIADVPPGSPLQTVLDVSATTLYNGLISLPIMISAYLVLLVYFLRHTA